jgi:FkbM family methyltransferase
MRTVRKSGRSLTLVGARTLVLDDGTKFAVKVGRASIESATDHILVPTAAKLAVLRNLETYPAVFSLLRYEPRSHERALAGRLSSIDRDNIYIFGAHKVGAALVRACRKQGVEVRGFLDNDTNKHGKTIENVPVFSPAQLDLGHASIVVASGRYANEIAKSLIPLGCIAYSIHDFQFAMKLSHQAEPNFRAFVTSLGKNRFRFISAFLQLDDERSRQVFDGLLRVRLTLDTSATDNFKCPFASEYLERQFVAKSDSHYYVDVGAYNGDSLDRIEMGLSASRRAYLFEPEIRPYQEAVRKYRDRLHVFAFNFGLSSRLQKIPYHSEYTYDVEHGNPDESFTPAIQFLPLDSMPIDRITLMKIDVEGGESDVIAGAVRTIARHRPTLAVCAYHRADDFWKLVSDVKRIHADYRVGMRHYSDIIDDTTLYFY